MTVCALEQAGNLIAHSMSGSGLSDIDCLSRSIRGAEHPCTAFFGVRQITIHVLNYALMHPGRMFGFIHQSPSGSGVPGLLPLAGLNDGRLLVGLYVQEPLKSPRTVKWGLITG